MNHLSPGGGPGRSTARVFQPKWKSTAQITEPEVRTEAQRAAEKRVAVVATAMPWGRWSSPNRQVTRSDPRAGPIRSLAHWSMAPRKKSSSARGISEISRTARTLSPPRNANPLAGQKAAKRNTRQMAARE